MDSNDPNNPNASGNSPLGLPSDPIVPGQPAAPSVDPSPAISTTPPSPWDVIPAQVPTPAPGFLPPATSAEPVGSPLPESPWSPATTITAADVPTAPTAPQMTTPLTENPATTNPFLQPQNAQSPSAPSATFDQTPAQTMAGPEPVAQNAAPFLGANPDPLNTAFTPTSAPESPFAIPSTALPADPSQPVAPGPPNPWDQPAPTETPAPQESAPDSTTPTPADPVSPSLNLMGQPGNPPQESAQIVDQSIPNPQTSSNPASVEPSQLSPTPLPEMGPVENAPTDLSHLIAGDETTPQQTNGVYTPPVAVDQNLSVEPSPTPAADGAAPPPGKHLNLTKVLLVAGIPIILIVAALSAYLILGVGQSAPEPTDETSLPIEQTQAPLTNPPQQIVAPSPATIPEPAASDALLPAEPSMSPSPSLSPAMRAAQQKASASPAATASPAASASTSLPQ